LSIPFDTITKLLCTYSLENMAEAEGKRPLLINVTDLQRETICNLFLHNDWDFEEMDLDIENEDETPETTKRKYKIEQKNGFDECPTCLCKPCITDELHRQMWWETENTAPSRQNHSLRKERYKGFWTMLFHREVFNDERYKARKLRALQEDPSRKKLMWHRRDLLPKCVLQLVRGWFPNPPDIPYMGHMWE